MTLIQNSHSTGSGSIPPLPFLAFDSSNTPNSPQIRTPFPQNFHLLVKGNFPEHLLELIKNAWFQSKETRATPQTSPCTLLSPCISFTSPTYPPLTIKLFGNGVSDPFIATTFNRDGRKEEVMIKIRETEVGCPRWEESHKKDIIPRRGCPPGTGAFVELLIGLFINNHLELLPELTNSCIIPRVAYAQMGHPIFAGKLDDPNKPQAPSVRGTGIIEEFIQGCDALKTVEALNHLPPLAQEFMAIMDILVLNNDRHLGNLLSKTSPLGNAVVLIDHGYALSQRGIDGGKFCWLQCNALQKTPSLLMQDFIRKIDEDSLEALAKNLSEELSSNLEKSPVPQLRNEDQAIKMDRILPHKIALCFMKEAIKENWSLSQIGSTLLLIPHAHQHGGILRECLVNEIYEELIAQELDPNDLKTKLRELCINAVKKAPFCKLRNECNNRSAAS